jgi:hypothetical protein
VGRSVKYPKIARTYKPTGVVMPFGTTAQRPRVAVNGTFRYNTDTSNLNFIKMVFGSIQQVGVKLQ